MRAAMSVRLDLPPGDVDIHAVRRRSAPRPAGAAARTARPRRCVGQHQAAALGGGDVLVGMEAEGHQVAERADAPCRASVAPKACAASSITRRPWLLGDRVEAVAVHRQAGEVHRHDGAGARRDRGLERSRSMLRVTGSTSTNTGLAPTRRMTLAVATQDSGVVMTSSPGPMPARRSAISSAAVPELSARTGRPPTVLPTARLRIPAPSGRW